MSSLNKVIIIGNVGKDPEIRSTTDGREVANFTVATSERWKAKDGEQKEKTEWHKIACFNPGLVNIIRNYITKGSKVYIEGSLQTRKWQDKDGQEKYSTEIMMQGYNCQLILLDKPSGNSESSPAQSSDYDDSGDVPF